MRFATSPRLLQVGREEREAKLRDFVAADLESRRSNGADAHTYTLLARAPDSPVARALAMLASELSSANVTLHVVLLDADTYTDEPGRPTLIDMANAEIRLLNDPRFTAAHEQLVLSPDRLWLGDCMRRDPAKRDAFEIFHEANIGAASHAAMSFSRLWASAKQVRRVRPMLPDAVIAAQIADDVAVQSAHRR